MAFSCLPSFRYQVLGLRLGRASVEVWECIAALQAPLRTGPECVEVAGNTGEGATELRPYKLNRGLVLQKAQAEDGPVCCADQQSEAAMRTVSSGHMQEMRSPSMTAHSTVTGC